MTTLGALSGLNEAPDLAGRRTIPFDYAFRYELTGKPGNIINETVTVSIEATFVAVSIGYGVIPKVTPVTFGPKLPPLCSYSLWGGFAYQLQLPRVVCQYFCLEY